MELWHQRQMICGVFHEKAIIPVILLRCQDYMLEYNYRESSTRPQIFLINQEEHPDSWVLFLMQEREVSLNDKKAEDICR